jgi:regulation of enolase protein 1 (concanavalin A-like superfamily)
MTNLTFRFVRLALALSGVTLLAGPVGAQGPLNKPTFAVTRIPTQVWDAVWPGDFNGDGRTDIVGGSADSLGPKLVLLIGNGDGTFGPPREVIRAFPFPRGVADFNEDGRLDLLIADHQTAAFKLRLLIGNGDGTFGDIREVADAGDDFAVIADFDRDGHRDIVTVRFDEVIAFPGNGDGTFDSPVTLFTDFGPYQGIAADLNGDGWPDLALSDFGGEVRVLLNRGGMAFTVSSIPFDRDLHDITAWDMDGDGDRELIVSGARFFEEPVIFYTDSRIWILENDGTGTFAPATAYETLAGPVSVVAGDFNRDDRPDVATVNRSRVYDRACRILHYSDSVSVFPGLGDGALAEATSYALAQGNTQVDAAFRGWVSLLNTSDLNGDGETDLIVSPGAFLLNRPEGANAEPTVSAGADTTINEKETLRLRGSASDPDFDWLTYRWTNASGEVLSTLPQACLVDYPAGTHDFTLTVDDGRGGVSSDVVRHRLLPQIDDEFESGDVGQVAVRGFSSRDGDVLSVTGSGFDIFGTRDEFHYVHQQRTGDFAVTTRVIDVQNLHRWVKAGLMVRESLSPRARHASIFATPTTERGVAFQRRTVTAGESTHTAGPVLAPPLWLGLTRVGNTVSAYYRRTTAESWTLVGTETFTDLAATVFVGLAVSSHVDGRLATARFDNFTLTSLADWSSQDIGAVGRAGRTAFDGLVLEMEGSGADMWGTADAFRYSSVARQGDVTITARVRSLENTHAWTKAGVMIRDGLGASARHVMLIVSATRGIAMQFRAAAGGITANAALRPGAAPAWVRLVRSGTTFTGFVSDDGESWTEVGTANLAMAESVRAGLAVTSHNNTTLATATFDGVAVTP